MSYDDFGIPDSEFVVVSAMHPVADEPNDTESLFTFANAHHTEEDALWFIHEYGFEHVAGIPITYNIVEYSRGGFVPPF
jgi:hypothetical protein